MLPSLQNNYKKIFPLTFYYLVTNKQTQHVASVLREGARGTQMALRLQLSMFMSFVTVEFEVYKGPRKIFEHQKCTLQNWSKIKSVWNSLWCLRERVQLLTFRLYNRLDLKAKTNDDQSRSDQEVPRGYDENVLMYYTTLFIRIERGLFPADRGTVGTR